MTPIVKNLSFIVLQIPEVGLYLLFCWVLTKELTLMRFTNLNSLLTVVYTTSCLCSLVSNSQYFCLNMFPKNRYVPTYDKNAQNGINTTRCCYLFHTGRFCWKSLMIGWIGRFKCFPEHFIMANILPNYSKIVPWQCVKNATLIRVSRNTT
jgi:hypothetical protein